MSTKKAEKNARIEFKLKYPQLGMQYKKKKIIKRKK